MKILLVNKFFYRKGGAEISFFDTANLLQKKRHKVKFFAMKHPDNLSSAYEKYFVSEVDYEAERSLFDKIKAGGRLLYSFEAKKKINELINNERPDIAHLNNIHHQISPSILHTLRDWNLPVVMSLRDYKLVCPAYTMLAKGKPCEKCKSGKYYWCLINRCSKNSYLKSLLNAMEMYLHHKILHIYDLVDVFISPSKFLKEKIKEMGFKGKVVYLPNFVNIDEYKPSYSWQTKSIVYFGRLSREKGLFTLLEAAKRLKLQLKIIGDGPLREEIEKTAEENTYPLGYLPPHSLKKEIKNSMAVVIPSEWYENNPRSISEAFALGKPVIGSRIGGIPELIDNGKTGLLFEPGNVDDLAAKISYLIKNKDQVRYMGELARKKAEQKYNSEKHYEKLMEIYQLALKNHKLIIPLAPQE